MDLGFTFDATEVPESERTEFELIPAGTRALMQITEADLVPTKSGQGIKYKAQIISGQYENRIVFGFINVKNASGQAEAIGQRELADLCLAIGRPQVDCTEDLLFAPFEGNIGVKQDKTGQYGPQNVIKKYHAQGAPVAAPKAAAPAQRQAAPAPAKPVGNKPWQTQAA